MFLTWLSGTYGSIAFITFWVALFGDDEDLFQAVFLALIWPVYLFKKAKEYLSE